MSHQIYTAKQIITIRTSMV